jgi:tetratricopeptide (TPR) repeat protein
MQPARRYWAKWLAAVAAAVVLAAAVYAFYMATRAGLAPANQSVRLAQVSTLREFSEGSNRRRAALASAREYLLDFPQERRSRLLLDLALAMADEPDADFSFIASQVEYAASGVLEHLPPGRPPRAADIQPAGLLFDSHWDSSRFATIQMRNFVLDDVDGDGRKDVIFACPGMGSSVCCLFRRTGVAGGPGRRWTPCRFGLRVPAVGIETFRITEKGPVAVVLASLADSPYQPNLFLDVFIWRRGRLENVLSAVIPNGWQWEYRQPERNGSREIRLYSHEPGAPLWDDPSPRQITTYRWDGAAYVPAAVQREPQRRSAGRPLDPPSVFLKAQELFHRGRTAQAAPLLDQSVRQGYTPEGAYYLGLCRALLGDYHGAMTAMRQAHEQNAKLGGANERHGGIHGMWQLSSRFLRAGSGPRDLPKALAASGQTLRLLELSAAATGPAGTPRAVLEAAGIPADFYQDMDLTRDGSPEALARVTWPGGAAVVVLRRAPGGGSWEVWPLAYAMQDPIGGETYPLDGSDIFYLPRAPAISVYPVASEVRVAGVRGRPGSTPEIVLDYVQNGRRRLASVYWDGMRFIAGSERDRVPQEDAGMRLHAVEVELFERRDYERSLQQLGLLEEQIREAPLASVAKEDLLLELFYHRALCYRKLGRAREAAVALASLWRSYPGSFWGRLARSHLDGAGAR